LEQPQTQPFSENGNGVHHGEPQSHNNTESSELQASEIESRELESVGIESSESESSEIESIEPRSEMSPTETASSEPPLSPQELFDSRQTDFKQQIEALIFSSDEALPVKTIRTALGDAELSDLDIERLIELLNQEYDATGRTFRIQHIANGFRFLTEKQFHGTIQKLLQPKLQRKLSQAALETLAIIAYKQPISKPELEAIRGTNADYVIRMLLEKNLVEVSGRGEGIGKPLLYGTTKEFLDYFNLGTLSDLPKPREIDELMREGDAQEFVTKELNARLRVELENDGASTEKTVSKNASSKDDGETDDNE
jgi:segregation and condensation protein B